MTDLPETVSASLPSPATFDIELYEPIVRNSGPVTKLTLRKPRAGELRGLSVQALFSCDVVAVLTVLPRISTPHITEVEAASLSTEDFAEISGTISGFFTTSEQKAALAQMLGAQP